MSYRNLKRLLGESSLERKCRLLLGVGILCFVGFSFYIYGKSNESLVWDQTKLTCQLLVNPLLLKRHWRPESGPEGAAAEPVPPEILRFLDRLPTQQDMGEIMEDRRDYESYFLRPNTESAAYMPMNSWERHSLRSLAAGDVEVVTQIDRQQQMYRYMAPVILKQSCMSSRCHPTDLDRKLGVERMKPGDMIAAISVAVPLSRTELAVNVNRAIGFSFAIATALSTMGLVYVMIRYVIVKPLAHLTDVSEQIAGGNMEIRANIQTGDEFEELSHAFNRMLRRLVSMQEELKKVNSDLDGKLDQLARANMSLYEMNRLKSEFLATVSHELRTPLNSILGFSDVIADAQELSPKHLRWVDNIRTSGKNLLKLINEILDLAKLEAGKMHVQVEEFSLRDVVEDQIQMVKPMADKKNIAVAAELEPGIPILRTDAAKLVQIMQNLLSNAIKFTPEGGQIIVRARPDRAHVIISVCDNGVGIAPEDQEVIFEKFRQVENAMTREHSGTGLGLSIVRELTKLLGGDEVMLESELGRGSTFTIRIPAQYVEPLNTDLTLDSDFGDSAIGRPNDIRFYTTGDVVRADNK